MVEREENQKVKKPNILLIAACTIIALSAIRYYRQNLRDSPDIKMEKTLVTVDDKQYEVHRPEEDDIDKETLEGLLNDPETKKFLEETN